MKALTWTRILFDFSKLAQSGWEQFSRQIYSPLKDELQSGTGFIRKIKERDEPNRKGEIATRMGAFFNKNDLSGLDDEINDLANAMLEINDRYSTKIYYDHIAYFGDPTFNSGFPCVASIGAFLETTGTNGVAVRRLLGITSRVVNESLSQANKSNAGEAGENIVRSILNAAGLVKDQHYREQYKSKEGSDTDFVFPNVPDKQDHKVDAFVAAQMSSNDRTRLTSSELKTGAKAFMFTGNGLKASKKKMSSVGHQIVEGLKSKRVQLVCYKGEIDREKARLAKAIKAGKKDIPELEARLEYFEDYTLSFGEFATYVRDRFA